MNYLNVALSALFSVIALFLITRIVGRRQVTELTVFDYINGISIGSIAANAATAPLDQFLEHLIAMIIFGGVSMLLALITDYNIPLRHLISGKPAVLFQDGSFRKKEMSRVRVDLSELLMLCRNQGYFDLSGVDSILMEPNGKLSILPSTAGQPATASQLQLKVQQEELPVCAVMDGVIQTDALHQMGYPVSRLQKELEKQKYPLHQVFLATLTPSGKLAVYLCKDAKKNTVPE